MAATAAAGFAYVISPGPAFLAVFGLAAAKGRGPAARFVTGHLLGDVTWGCLAFASILGVSQVGPLLFQLLGLACGTYLVWLGARALLTRRDAPPVTIGHQRPLVTGMLFGLTNPKAYPVSAAMFTAIALPFAAGDLHWSDGPALLGAALVGFVLADLVIVFAAGLPAVRRFFARHALAITRGVGVLFIAFGARSLIEAGHALGTGRG